MWKSSDGGLTWEPRSRGLVHRLDPVAGAWCTYSERCDHSWNSNRCPNTFPAPGSGNDGIDVRAVPRWLASDGDEVYFMHGKNQIEQVCLGLFRADAGPYDFEFRDVWNFPPRPAGCRRWPVRRGRTTSARTSAGTSRS